MGQLIPDAYNPDQIPEVGELDELETFVRSKKLKSGARSAVDHFRAGILGWVLGDHSAETFAPLWKIVASWQCYFIVTDGWSVYPCFIPPGDQIVSKTANRAGGYLQLASGGCAYMTRVEGEKTRLRHYLAPLHRKTLCYSKSLDMLAHSIRLLHHYLKFGDIPVPHRA